MVEKLLGFLKLQLNHISTKFEENLSSYFQDSLSMQMNLHITVHTGFPKSIRNIEIVRSKQGSTL